MTGNFDGLQFQHNYRCSQIYDWNIFLRPLRHRMHLHQCISNAILLFILASIAIGTVGKSPKIDSSWIVNEAQSKHQTCELSTQIRFLCFLECWRILFEHQKEYLIKLKFWCLEKIFIKILHTILNRITGKGVYPIGFGEPSSKGGIEGGEGATSWNIKVIDEGKLNHILGK